MVINFTVILLCFALTLHATPLQNEDDLSLTKALDRLFDVEPGVSADYETAASDTRDFQDRLTETDELSSEAFATSSPRCGVKDDNGDVESDNEVTDKGSNRPMTRLNYNIKKYPANLRDVEKYGQDIAQVLKIWSNSGGLCSKDKIRGRMNIAISFDFMQQGDEKTLNHTCIPSCNCNAECDKKEICTTEDKIEPINVPDICKDASLDTITRMNDGRTYAFKGDFYWKIIDKVIAEGYPRRISEDWDGLEGNLDASFTGIDGKTYFFKGGRYWSFTHKKMDKGYPKDISDGFEGIPHNLDAAVVWGENGAPYFFKGDYYWRYDRGEIPAVKDSFPRSNDLWKGFPLGGGIDAAVLWTKGVYYFFKGKNYYRYDDATSEVSKSYPLETGPVWFSCRY